MFKRLNKIVGGPKATSELDASRDPMGFIQRNKNMSIKGLKGVAFNKGGLVSKQDELFKKVRKLTKTPNK